MDVIMQDGKSRLIAFSVHILSFFYSGKHFFFKKKISSLAWVGLRWAYDVSGKIREQPVTLKIDALYMHLKNTLNDFPSSPLASLLFHLFQSHSFNLTLCSFSLFNDLLSRVRFNL